MVITDIKTQTKDPLRENVYLDGKFAFGIAAEKRFEHRLKVGGSLAEGEIRELVYEDQVGKLINFAQRYLSFRPRSTREIRDHLKRKLEKGEYVEPDKILGEVIKKLTKLGLIDDEEFAKWWVGQRQKFKPRGERLLRAELHAKGIDREIIDGRFHDYHSPGGEAEAVARRKLSSYSRLPDRQFRAKMGAYLARRGYEWDVVTEIVDRLVRTR